MVLASGTLSLIDKSKNLINDSLSRICVSVASLNIRATSKGSLPAFDFIFLFLICQNRSEQLLTNSPLSLFKGSLVLLQIPQTKEESFYHAGSRQIFRVIKALLLFMG